MKGGLRQRALSVRQAGEKEDSMRITLIKIGKIWYRYNWESQEYEEGGLLK
jgi:hypothetical protein